MSIFKFKGGVHPEEHKILTESKQIEEMPVSKKLFIPLRQHIGEACTPLVKTGDLVKKGQLLADSQNNRVPVIHSPTSGKIIDIGNYPHPAFGMSTAIVLESDGKDQWFENLITERSFEKLSIEEIVDFIYKNGIVGLGGAAFPTHVKVVPPQDKKIDTLIVNGAECEPYLTSDYRLMIEYPEQIVKGILISKKILNVDNCILGIENNKPEAIQIMEKACAGTGIKIAVLETHYPQGGEKMMIKAILGKEVPSGKLPMDVGCVVQNIGTLYAVANAVEKNIPLIERVVTVSGKAVNQPKNIRVKLGTTYQDIADFCGGLKEQPAKIIMGGPMMGLAQSNLGTPVIKATSGVLFLTKKETFKGNQKSCIRCGRCLEACTMRLRPNMLSILSEKNMHEKAMTDFSLLDCVECGCCAYVCPANRNIVHLIRVSKTKNAAKKTKK